MEILKQKAREIVLGVLLLVLAIVVWQRMSGPSSDDLPQRGAAGRADLSEVKIYPVDWAALTAPRPGYDPSGRNIFQFGAIPVPTPPPPTPEELAALEALRKKQEEAARLAQEELRKRQQETMAQQQQAQQQTDLPPPPPPKPRPPTVPYKFIGYVGPPEKKVAVLHDGNELLFAGRGEVVGERFRVLEIGYESIKFGFTDPEFKSESQTLPMSSSY